MTTADLAHKDTLVPYYALLPYSFLDNSMHLTYTTYIPVNPICLGLPEDEFYDCWKESPLS